MSAIDSPVSTTEPEVRMRDRENSTVSDVVMSDRNPPDPESPTTDPSTYSDAHQVLEHTPSQEQEHDAEQLAKSVANSPLFKLPKELRLRIYSYCLSSRYSVLWPQEHLAFGLQPQLLRTCSTILQEAAGVLYSNMLHFIHPSDANMFLWAHNPELSRGVSKMLLQVRDRDVGAIWTGYLSSTKPERSLMNDYPNLRTLHIQFRSGYLHSMHPHLHRRFEQWENEPSLRELLLGLRDRKPPVCDVKVLVCSRMLAEDARALSNSFPSHLERVREPGNDRRIIYRTPWKESISAQIALEIEGQEQSRYFGQ